MTPPVRAVTFDCWGTLLHDRDMERARIRRAAALVDAGGGRLSAEDASELMERAWRAHHDAWVAGRHYGAEGIARFCAEALGAEHDGVVDVLCAAFEDASLDGDVAPVPGSVETLAAARRAGLRTALVCDTGFSPGRIVRTLLEGLGHAEHLEVLAFSNEIGVPKPDARMFACALDAIGVAPAQAVHVGDLRRTDIAGARAIGMRTVRITAIYDDPSDLPDADAVIGSYDELPAVLRGFGAAL